MINQPVCVHEWNEHRNKNSDMLKDVIVHVKSGELHEGADLAFYEAKKTNPNHDLKKILI